MSAAVAVEALSLTLGAFRLKKIDFALARAGTGDRAVPRVQSGNDEFCVVYPSI